MFVINVSPSRFEKESWSMKTWLDRCESACRPGTDLLSADKRKLRNELQIVQVNYFSFLFLECISSSLLPALIRFTVLVFP